jgi:hypothetical protein
VILDVRRPITDARSVIDQNELRAAFEATASEMPDDLELMGVTFHGSAGHREWVAFAGENGDPSASCEGWGDSPFEALTDLARHVAQER